MKSYVPVFNRPMMLWLGLPLVPKPPADAEDVPVRVANVHLANAPRHVGRRPRDVKTLLEAALVNGVNVVHPDRHPCALVRGIVAFRAERHLESTLAPTALA